MILNPTSLSFKASNIIDFIVNDFIFPGSTIAVHAAETSNDTLWFTKVVCKKFYGNNHVHDDYGNIILPHRAYFTGNFLERVCYKKTNQVFKVSNLKTFFYGENVFTRMLPRTSRRRG